MAGGAVLFSSVGMISSGVQAASGNYEAMVLSCIDPRFQDLVNKQQASDGLSGKYSAFTIAGASIGRGGSCVPGLACDFLGKLGRIYRLA